MTAEAEEEFDLRKFTSIGGAALTSDSMYWGTCALSEEFVTVSFSFF